MCAILIMNTIDGGFFVLEITSSKNAGSYFFSHRKSKHRKWKWLRFSIHFLTISDVHL